MTHFQQLGSHNASHNGPVWGLCPVSESAAEHVGHFITGGRDGRLATWRIPASDTPERERERERDLIHKVRAFSKHALPIVCVSTSRDGPTAVSTSLDGAVKVWNVSNDRRTVPDPKPVQMPTSLPSDPWCVAVSTDGERAVLAGAYATLHVLDCNLAMVEHVHQLTIDHLHPNKHPGHPNRDQPMILAIDMAHDDARVLVACSDGSVAEVDVEKGTLLSKRLQTHHAPVRTVKYIPSDTTCAVTAADDGLICLHDMRQAVSTAVFKHPALMVLAAAPSPQGAFVAAGLSDGGVVVWDRAMRTEPVFSANMHQAPVWGACWAKGAHNVVSVSDDHCVGLVSCVAGRAGTM